MSTTDKTHDLAMPANLTAPARRAHEIIVAYLKEHGFADNSGCKAFYAPAEWAAREEKYGADAHLVVVYDGGAVRPVFSMDAAYDLDCARYQKTGQQREPYALYEGMQQKLREAGLWFEECTGWYCAVYGSSCPSSVDLDPGEESHATTALSQVAISSSSNRSTTAPPCACAAQPPRRVGRP